MSIATGLVALGSTQASALPISAKYNYFSTVAASTGCILRNDVAVGTEIHVKNGGANTLNIYPPLGGTADAGATNAATTIAAGVAARLHYAGNGNWYRSY